MGSIAKMRFRVYGFLKKLFGRKKLYPILDIELFGKGEWHPEEVNS